MIEQERYKTIDYLKKTGAYPDEDDYNFLSSRITLNDYQFNQIFKGNRQVGHTWGAYMETLLEVKSARAMTVHAGEIDNDRKDNIVNTQRDQAELADFLKFIKKYFNEDFTIGHTTRTQADITYTATNSKNLHDN